MLKPILSLLLRYYRLQTKDIEYIYRYENTTIFNPRNCEYINTPNSSLVK